MIATAEARRIRESTGRTVDDLVAGVIVERGAVTVSGLVDALGSTRTTVRRAMVAAIRRGVAQAAGFDRKGRVASVRCAMVEPDEVRVDHVAGDDVPGDWDLWERDADADNPERIEWERIPFYDVRASLTRPVEPVSVMGPHWRRAAMEDLYEYRDMWADRLESSAIVHGVPVTARFQSTVSSLDLVSDRRVFKRCASDETREWYASSGFTHFSQVEWIDCYMGERAPDDIRAAHGRMSEWE